MEPTVVALDVGGRIEMVLMIDYGELCLIDEDGRRLTVEITDEDLIRLTEAIQKVRA